LIFAEFYKGEKPPGSNYKNSDSIHFFQRGPDKTANDVTINISGSSGHFELNVFKPVIYMKELVTD